jgi:outer membrane biogenesis lipoprotein LolB
MMARQGFRSAALCAGVALLLLGCGERPQTQNQAQTRQEQRQQAGTEAWSAGSSSGFKAAGWTPGDQASWERHMRARSQNQNEYVRIQGKGG